MFMTQKKVDIPIKYTEGNKRGSCKRGREWIKGEVHQVHTIEKEGKVIFASFCRGPTQH